MSSSAKPLRAGQRRLLWVSFMVNVAGALLFIPPCAPLRALFGLPDGPAFYLWLIASWILILGLGYLEMARTNQLHGRTLGVGAACKVTFALLVFAGVVTHRFPQQASLLALTDMVLAVVYLDWLREK